MIKPRNHFLSFLLTSLVLHGMVFSLGFFHQPGLKTAEPSKPEEVVQVFLLNHEEKSGTHHFPLKADGPIVQKQIEPEKKTPIIKRTFENPKITEVPINRTEPLSVNKYIHKDVMAEPLVKKVMASFPELPVKLSSSPMKALEEPSHVHLSGGEIKNEGRVANESNPSWRIDLLMKYKEEIARRIMESKRYPLLARKKNLEGKVVLAFTIGAGGTIERISVIRSSREKVLDQEAVDTIRRVSPLPPIPEGIGVATVKVRIPLNFNLNDE